MTPLLSVKDLVKHFPVKKGLLQQTVGQVRAVDGVSFDIGPGETLGLVEESGCGKSTVGKTILKLIDPTAGEIRLSGARIDRLSKGRDAPVPPADAGRFPGPVLVTQPAPHGARHHRETAARISRSRPAPSSNSRSANWRARWA